MSITLRQVKGFLAAAEHLSFSRAAKQLQISPSAFSQLVQELESILDLRLFDRTTREVVLTDAGMMLLPKMRKSLLAIDEVYRGAQEFRLLEKGYLSVGTLPSVAGAYIIPAISEFRRHYPKVIINLYEAQNHELLPLIKEGNIELCFCAVTRASHELIFTPIYNESFVAILPAQYYSHKNKQINWSEIVQFPLIMMRSQSSTRNAIESALAMNGLKDEATCEATNPWTAIQMVKAGLGVTIMPITALESMDLRGLSIYNLVEPIKHRTVASCQRRNTSLSVIAQDFLEIVDQYVVKNLKDQQNMHLDNRA